MRTVSIISLLGVVGFAFFWIFFTHKKYEHDILALVLMVKNEADVIIPTLQPFIDAGVTSFFVFDTGSTDGTQDAVRSHFSMLPACKLVLAQEPFIDFAASRNRALRLAEQAFSHATFLLMPDAEWYMRDVRGLLQFCMQQKTEQDRCYLVRIANEYIDFYTPRLIRAHCDVVFTGAVHEIIEDVSELSVPSATFFELRVAQKGHEKSRARWVRDCEILKKEIVKDPTNPRTLFYLAQTYECLEDWTNAVEMYKNRNAVQGWDEEDYMALYKTAYCLDRLGEERDIDNWPEVLSYYLRAYAARPWRAEPLVRIAEYYVSVDEPDLAQLFARRTLELEYPSEDVLFIEKDAYAHRRYDSMKQLPLASL